MYTGKTPDLSNLKIFGYINIPKLFRRKFDSKAQKEMWDLKAIQEMWEYTMPSTRRIKESKDVTIYEEDITTNDKAAEMQVVVSARMYQN